MGANESVVLPKEHKPGKKDLDLSRDVTHKAFVKHSQGEINYNCLTEFPWELRDSVTMYESINVSFNHISEIPEEIPLRIPHLTRLTLSHNKISSLPETFLLFFHLKELCVDHNELEVIPKALIKLTTLEKVDLSHNYIKELPDEMDELQSLAKLNLCNNKLKVLPQSLTLCPLKVILVQGNQLQKPKQHVCDEGSRETIEALRSMCSIEYKQPKSEVNEFPRVRASFLKICGENPSSMHQQYSQLQIFPDRVKTPLIPPLNSSCLQAYDLRDRIVGLLYGAAIGDALAIATQGLTKDECLFHYDPEQLTYNDIIRDELRTRWRKGDWTTSFDQMVLVLDSIIHWAGVVDELEFAKRLLAWSQKGFPELGDKRGFTFSETVDAALAHPGFLSDPHKAANQSQAYNDDNALVRALVAGIPQFHNLEEVMANSTRICKTTHVHPLCVASSALLSGMVALLLQGDVHATEPSRLIRDSFQVAQQYLTCEESRSDFSCLLEMNLPERVRERNGDCMKSLSLAIQSLHWHKDYRTTLLKVIMNGGDSKVGAVVTGALHGALAGYSFLPNEWVAQLLPKQTDWLNTKINHLLDLMAIP